MTKKLGWLDKFAEDQAKKMTKTASLKKQAEQIIVDTEDLPEVVDGQEIVYKNASYKVVDASFSDEVGPGIVLEKINKVTAELDEEIEIKEENVEIEEVPAVEELAPEMSMEMGTTVAPTTPDGEKKVTDAPEKAVQPDQGNAGLHIEVRDTVEVDKFQEEAVETENQIASENAVDRTVPEGKYNRIETRIQNMTTETTEVAPIEETPEVEETSVIEETTEVEEVPVVEETSTETTEVECDEFVDVDNDGVCDDCGLVEEECPAEKEITSNRILKRIRQ